MKKDILSGFTGKMEEVLEGLSLIVDLLMSKAFQDRDAVQTLLDVLIPEYCFTVLETRTQVEAGDLAHRNVRFDILAIDKYGRRVNIEMQRSKDGFSPKRIRYNMAILDGLALEKGMDVKNIPDNFVICITAWDPFGEGLPIYHRRGRIDETGAPCENGAHEIYVNGAWRGDDALGRLMSDLHSLTSQGMHYPALANVVHRFKETEEGRMEMYEGMKDFAQELTKYVRSEVTKEVQFTIAKSMIEDGSNPIEKIAQWLDLSLSDVEALQKECEAEAAEHHKCHLEA